MKVVIMKSQPTAIMLGFTIDSEQFVIGLFIWAIVITF